MKNHIIYACIHHKNTERLLKCACDELDIELVNIKDVKNKDLSNYETVGFASGIYHGKFHQSLFNFIESCEQLPENVFLIHTSGSGKLKYNSSFTEQLQKQNVHIVGNFHCKGLDTFGFFKYIGGISKKHPNKKDIVDLISFLSDIIE